MRGNHVRREDLAEEEDIPQEQNRAALGDRAPEVESPIVGRARKLASFEFVGLCLIAFLIFCNVAVYYNLFNYLQGLGIPGELSGFLIGAYSLTAMVLFLTVSPFLNAANAPRAMLIGMAIAMVAGFGYFFIHGFWGLLALRIVTGCGYFLVSAGTMAIFVSVIPLERSGQAFGLYSVAILLPYGWVPTIMDALAPVIPSPPYGYALATSFFLPAAWIVMRIRRRLRLQPEAGGEKKTFPSWPDLRTNLTHLPVALLILLNLSYFALWGSLFFLFKGFANQQQLANVGIFFIVQTGLMIVIRLFAGRLFDLMSKVTLVVASFAIIALGYLALDHLTATWAVPLVALLFGFGMGTGYPTINGLMIEVSSPRFRALNANLMLFAVQGGFFLGPLVGGTLVVRHGYHGYFLGSLGLAGVSALLGTLLARRKGTVG